MPHPSRPASPSCSAADYPILQTGMGWVATPALVAGACNAGAFGFLAAATIPPGPGRGRDPRRQGAHEPALRRQFPDGRPGRRRDQRCDPARGRARGGLQPGAERGADPEAEGRGRGLRADLRRGEARGEGRAARCRHHHRPGRRRRGTYGLGADDAARFGGGRCGRSSDRRRRRLQGRARTRRGAGLRRRGRRDGDPLPDDAGRAPSPTSPSPAIWRRKSPTSSSVRPSTDSRSA